MNRRTTRPPTRAPSQPPAEAASTDNLPSAEAASEALKALTRWRLKMMANRIYESRSKGLAGG